MQLTVFIGFTNGTNGPPKPEAFVPPQDTQGGCFMTAPFQATQFHSAIPKHGNQVKECLSAWTCETP
jgi:hypothetical protein